jgi:hypothetical protein
MDFLVNRDVLAGNIHTMSTQHCTHTTSITQTRQQRILCCATLVTPPPLVCRPLCFADSLSRCLHLLWCYCALLVQLVVVLPGGLSPPLSRRLRLSSRLTICWLLHCIVLHCPAPWPPLSLSSHLRLLLHPSHTVGCCVVLPGTLASLPLLSCLCPAHCRNLLLRHCAPLFSWLSCCPAPWPPSPFHCILHFWLIVLSHSPVLRPPSPSHCTPLLWLVVVMHFPLPWPPSPPHHTSISHHASLVWLVAASCCPAPQPPSSSHHTSAWCISLSSCCGLLSCHCTSVWLVFALPITLASLPLLSHLHHQLDLIVAFSSV